MSNSLSVACDCEHCKFDHGCCSSDSWTIVLTPEEASRLIHVRLPDGRYVVASGKDGKCIYCHENGYCSIYDERPETCRAYTCEGKENVIQEVVDRHNQIRESMKYTHSGYIVAFLFTTNKQKVASNLIITDPDTKKEISLPVAQIFGTSEGDVKQKMIELIQQPFKQESI